MKNTRYTGTISFNAKGTGFVTAENIAEDVIIPQEFTDTALQGDAVEFEYLPKRRKDDRQFGKITAILKRRKTQLVGTLQKDESGKRWFITPDDKKIGKQVLLYTKAADEPRLEINVKVLVELRPWKDRTQPLEGEIVDFIGEKGKNETEMRSILAENGIVYDFPKEVEDEADRIKNDFYAGKLEKEAARKDFRKTPTFTIDPKTAKDFDDALSVKKINEDLYEIGIHIADVSFFVRPGSVLDKEALNRGFSTYLVDRTIPMLPHSLSQDICSLNPHTDRYTFSVVCEMNRKGIISKTWIGRAIIYSDHRFTYEEAQEVLDKGQGTFFEELKILEEIAKNREISRKEKGSIDFSTSEIEFVLDPEGKPIDIKRKENLFTHKLIEEYMLLANEVVAETASVPTPQSRFSHKRPFLFRIHDTPPQEKLQNLEFFLKTIGITETFLPKGRSPEPKDIQRLLEKVRGTEVEEIIKTSTIRSMAKAAYSAKNVGHFGLAIAYYTHFTSPIRRYADISVHRLLLDFLNNKETSKTATREIGKIADLVSEKELSVVSAERDSIAYKQAEYFESFIGKDFTVTIVSIVDWGIFVEEMNTKTNGLIHISNLPEDVYETDPFKSQMTGKNTNRIFKVGEKLEVVLTNASKEDKRIDFSLK